MEQEIQKAIISTLAYFDIFEFPLKQEEIWQGLFVESARVSEKEINRAEFLKCLAELTESSVIKEKDGYYFFSGRENILAIREQRRVISEQKIKKARRLIKWWLRFIPWIKAIFLANSVSYYNATENSDIDLFIIAEKNRLWLTRFLAILPLKILNLRPTKDKKENKFCLSYFVSKDNLNLEKYELAQNFPILVYWSTFFMFLYGERDYWIKFWQDNEWIRKYLPNWGLGNFGEVRNDSQVGCGLNLNWLEHWLKKFQLWYLPQELKQAAFEQEKNSVYLSDNIIKLHLGSRIKGKEIWEKWREKVNYE